MAMVSVILCTYNPKVNILEQTLKGLKEQTLGYNSWELLIIDNNSNNGFQDQLDLAWHPGAQVIVEKNQGLTNARICGIKNASSNLIIFVDDDNILNEDYLSEAIEIEKNYPFLGAWGGVSIGKYEVPPPKWFSKKQYEMLAIRDVSRNVWSNKYFDSETNPIGAGLVIRKDVGLAYVKNIETNVSDILLDRNGTSLLSGGDNDIVFMALNLGYGSGCFKSLILTHLISKDRLTESYILKLTENIAMSNVILYHKYGLDYPLPVRPRGFATDILYKFQRSRMDSTKRNLMDAEVKGILKGKDLLKS